MAELTEYQLNWITENGGSKIDIAALTLAQDEAQGALDESATPEEIAEARAAVLDQMASDAMQAEIDAALGTAQAKQDLLDRYVGANSELAQCKQSLADVQGFSLKRKGKAMKWKASDSDLSGWKLHEDVEIDTRADTRDLDAAMEERDRENVRAVLDRLMAMSHQMAAEIDENGERVFSDDDIRRELWTPLVRDRTIPDNLVPPEFSDQAIAIQGAFELYQDRIDEYSKASTGYEGLMRGMGIAGDTLQLMGTVATSVVTIEGATEKARLNEEITSGKDADGKVLTDEQIAKAKADKAAIEQREGFTKLGVTIATGGFDLTQTITKEAVKDKEERDWIKVSDDAIKYLSKVVAAGVGPCAKEIIGLDAAAGVDGQTAKDDALEKQRTADAIQAGILGGLSGLRMAPTLAKVIKAKPGADRRAIVEQMVEQFADMVQLAIKSKASTLSDDGEKAQLIEAAAAIRSLIVITSKAERAVELMLAKKPGEAAMCLGAAVFQDGATIGAMLAIDPMRRDVSATEYDEASTRERLFMEDRESATVESGRASRLEAATAAIDTLSASITEESLQAMAAQAQPAVDPAMVAQAEDIRDQIEQQQAEAAQAELEEKFGDKAFVEEMFAEFDAKMVGYDDIYKEANPASVVEGTPDEVADAIAAIDRAIAQTSAVRARAEMINSITSGGAGLVTALVPGTGAVAAAQAVAFDIYCLVQAVQKHNEWCDSMEIAFRAHSAYAKAIEKTMKNARITLSQKSVKLVLSSLKLGNEVGRCFDPTGATTIVAASLTMTQALVDYGYKMRKEVEITRGWRAYKAAREDPENRKAARKAIGMNSTLAKCSIAYGACMEKDPAAQEAIRISGLTPSILADSKDVCVKLVSYLENELSDDPVVMAVDRQPKNWQPAGRPVLKPESWFEIKTAASLSAVPRLDPASVKTPGMDRCLADLQAADCWNGYATYNEWRKAEKPNAEDAADRHACAEKSIELLERIIAQMSSYKPLAAGTTSDVHQDMADIAETYAALAQLNIRVARTDLIAPEEEHEDNAP